MTHFDVVVIGSGAGGAPVACRLAEAGLKVVVVERGKSVTRDDFDRDELEWCRRDRFIPSAATDPHTRRANDDEDAWPTSDGWISTVVGGGTVHMGAYLLRADPLDALQASRCANAGVGGTSALDWAVPFDDVARLYPIAERELGVSGAPGGTEPALPVHALAHKLDDAARALGMPVIHTPRGILTTARPDEDRLACDLRDLCTSYGCPRDARSSMPATYLRRGQRTGNLSVWSESMATRIEREPSTQHTRASAVVVKSLADGNERTVRCGAVVVACGAIESSRLLLLSGDAFNARAQVGKHLWFCLGVEVTGFFEASAHPDVHELMGGSPFLNRTVHHGGHLDAAAQQRAGIDRTGMLEAMFVHDNPIHRAERAALDGPAGLVWGSALKQKLRREFTAGRTVVLEGLGESLSHDGARIDLDPVVTDALGLPVARITHSHHPRDVLVAAHIAAEGKALLQAMGAVDVRVTRPLSETLVLQGGTCRFGDDASTSVTNVDGALHDVDNVYVADGASLPSSLSVPSTLTIVANSLRIAERMLVRLRARG